MNVNAGQVGGRPLSRLRRDWRNHRMDARRRGISFELTFEGWLRIWVDSGRLAERGPHKGQYVMARFGDKGAYAVGNVRVALVQENHAEAWVRPTQRAAQHRRLLGNKYRVGKKASVEQREALSLARMGNTNRRGKTASEETRAKISAALRGNKNTLGRKLSAATRAKMSAARLGKSLTAATRKKLSEAAKRRWG